MTEQVATGGTVANPGAAPTQQAAPMTAAQPAAPMTAAQQSGIGKLAEIRAQISDPMTTREQKDGLMAQLSNLSRHVFLDEKYGEAKPDPRATSNEPYIPGAEIAAPLREAPTKSDLSELVAAGKVKGLSEHTAGAVAAFVDSVKMPRVVADTLLDSVSRHYGATFDEQAVNVEPLSQREEREFFELAASAHPGGQDGLNKLSGEVRDLLQRAGMLADFDKKGLTRTSLAFDSRVLNSLKLWLTARA